MVDSVARGRASSIGERTRSRVPVMAPPHREVLKKSFMWRCFLVLVSFPLGISLLNYWPPG
ncbi:MAG: hypothetical protein DME56_10215 [Verrucomicrobia bacterium]|nr:MAG: hypothetical protein DME56_10215 [Verrucomicrobiota bacterium]